MVGGDPYCCELLLHDHAQVGCVDENGWQEIHQVIHTHKQTQRHTHTQRKTTVMGGVQNIKYQWGVRGLDCFQRFIELIFVFPPLFENFLCGSSMAGGTWEVMSWSETPAWEQVFYLLLSLKEQCPPILFHMLLLVVLKFNFILKKSPLSWTHCLISAPVSKPGPGSSGSGGSDVF